jgi:hypothetical protein
MNLSKMADQVGIRVRTADTASIMTGKDQYDVFTNCEPQERFHELCKIQSGNIYPNRPWFS